MLLGDAPATIYQTPAFQSTWLDEIGSERGIEPAALLMRVEERAAMLLPLAIEQAGPLRIAQFPGGKHANFNMPLMTELAEPIPAPTVLDLLRRAAREARLDVLALRNQPVAWQGVRNPLHGMLAQDAPSHGHMLSLDTDAEAVMQRLHSKEKRRKLRQKHKWLDQLGPVRFEEALDESTIDAMLDVYFRQKRRRFDSLGIADPFAHPDDQRFLRRLARAPADHLPALRLFGLKLGERYVSIWGAGVHGGSASGMITSFDDDQAIARTSPGELLLERMLRCFCAEGVKRFDFGVGEAQYKSLWSDEMVPLFDLIVATSLRGQPAALIMRRAAAAKRAIKQSPGAMAVLKRARRLRAA